MKSENTEDCHSEKKSIEEESKSTPKKKNLKRVASYSIPTKAIEASIKKRRQTNGGDSELSTRKDVVHKAIFRAMKRYYSAKFENEFGDQEIHKDEFKRQVQ